MLCSAPVSARRPPALATLYAANAHYVAGVLRRLGVAPADVDDLVQDVFIVVLRRLDEYDDRERTQAWLFGICLRVVAAYRRRGFRKHERPAGAACGVGLSSAEPDPEGAALARSRCRRLERMLARMPAELREVLVLFELVELGCAEIARLMATPVGTVYSRLHTARRELARIAARAQAGEA